MSDEKPTTRSLARNAPLEMSAEQFQSLGYQLTDQISEFLGSLSTRHVIPVSVTDRDQPVFDLQESLPAVGTDAGVLLANAAELLFDQGIHQHHPRWMSWITGAASPIGTLGEYLAASVNQGVAAATGLAAEIEAQTIRWIAEILGYPTDCAGLFLSGGNLANITAFHAARTAQTGWDIRSEGILKGGRQLYVYGSAYMHGWIEKAADMSGIGRNAIRRVPTDKHLRIDPELLREAIERDLAAGGQPFLVIGHVGTTETGAIDPLRELSEIARTHDCWFHVDAAYGGVAALLPDLSEELRSMELADSIVVDPHKWLYAPKGAGCVLVRKPHLLYNAFTTEAPYFQGMPVDNFNYYELGPENTRGLRALKVWLALRQVGRDGFAAMVADDVRLARALYDLARTETELEPLTHSLSITTFRYVPPDLRERDEPVAQAYLDDLNRATMRAILASGDAAISNAVIGGRFALRVCIVNFRTSLHDIEAVIELTLRHGRRLDATLRPDELKATSDGPAQPNV